MIVNKAGEKVHSGVTPSSVTLRSSSGYFKSESYTLTFKKDGYVTKEQTLRSSIDGWYYGNILLGGVIGMLIVDPATGAMYKLPPRVDASLDADDKQARLKRVKALTIVSIDSLSAAQRARLVEVE